MINKITKTYSQSPAFYSSKAPVAYGFFDDIGSFFEKDVGGFFEKAGHTFVDGFEKFAEGIKKGNWDKVSEGAIRILTPIEKVTKEEINKHFDEKSHEEKKSLLENFAKKFIDIVNKSAEMTRDEASTIREGLREVESGKFAEGIKKLFAVIIEPNHDINTGLSKEMFQVFTKILNTEIENSKEFLDHLGLTSHFYHVSETINQVIMEEDVEMFSIGIDHISKPHNSVANKAIHKFINHNKESFEKAVEKLNTFSDELTSIADKLNEDIKDENLEKIIKDMDELKQIDHELAEYSPTIESTSDDEIALYSEFTFF